MLSRAVVFVAAWAWLPYLALEFAATHWPEPQGPKPPGALPWDKVWHFLAFVAAGALAALALRVRRSRGWRPVLSVAIALAAYSFLDEATQPLFRRDSEWLDWAADLSGIAVGMTLVGLLPRRSQRDTMPATDADRAGALTTAGSRRP